VTEPLVGAIVDTRYELRRLVARGGMGLVFEAHHRFTRRTVALKLLRDENRTHKEARARLLREAHALTTVRHPGIVEVLDAGVCGEHGPYVVLEMLEGRTLDGILAARRRLPVADAVHIARQVCDAVAHAHGRGVVHRDLKPSNLFVARTEVGREVVKLIDLGVAAVAEERLVHLDQKLTTAHEVLGTPEYMAPEQLWGRPTDARTDVYALGMSLFECLTGELPYVGPYPEVLVQVSQATRPPSVYGRRPDVGSALATVIERALEKDPTNRFASARELGHALVAATGLAFGATNLLSSPASGTAESARPSGAGQALETSVAAADESEEQAIGLVRRKPLRSQGVSHALPPKRRQFARAPYATPVFVVSTGARPVEARSEEISEEGMLIVCPAPFALGARLVLRFASPMTGEPLEAAASVRWTREGRGRSALGLEFEDAPPQVRSAIVEYIATIGGGKTL
jgi:serine/threonine protein kinase